MEDLIREWGYLILFLYSFGGGFLALAVAGVLSYAGELNIYISLIVAGTANFIGDQFLFYLARTNKNYAKQMMGKHKRKIALAHLMMRKYGNIVVFLQKYIYGIKTLIPLAMGITKYDAKKFMFFNFFATILWALVIGYAAFALGELVYTFTDDFKTYGIAFIIILFIGLSILYRKL